ncbi:phosphopantetheine-binding protein [Streptomyces sp. ST2-7A]|nr:phosphopantetheine-binding protein [Streptomyces sp. ST2-7A]MCE7081125.1 phosphopantetheine-binding protein [Streptomyces sp. ST2-7A]
MDRPTHPFRHTRHWIGQTREPDRRSGSRPLLPAEVEENVEKLAALLGIDPDASLREALPALRAWQAVSTAPETEEQAAPAPTGRLTAASWPPGPDRAERLLELIRTHAAAVLGHDALDEIDAGEELLDAGMASVGVLELRQRLGEELGMELPMTLVYDHPTPAGLAAHLDRELPGGRTGV